MPIRTIAYSILFVLLSVASLRAGKVEIRGDGPPKLIVAKIHADWCPNCKALKPKLEGYRKQFASDPVLFITLDLTDDQSNEQSRLLANAIGIEETLREHNGTGKVLIIDALENKVVQKFGASDIEDGFVQAVHATLR